jgi:hypothetical protein
LLNPGPWRRLGSSFITGRDGDNELLPFFTDHQLADNRLTGISRHRWE